MNTNYLAALGTSPPFLFVSDELSYAEFADVLKIVNHAHAICGFISLIQMVQFIARKAVAPETVFNSGFHNIRTVLDSTCDSGFWFDAVVAPATRTWLLISYICTTEATIHAAWSDQICAKHIFLCRSYLHHLLIPKGLHGGSVLNEANNPLAQPAELKTKSALSRSAVEPIVKHCFILV